MARAISNKNLCNANFQVAEFTGEWLESFGKPELRGAWLIYGESGTGKTHFALQLLKYLTEFVPRAAYDTIEQGKSLSFQNAWCNADMQTLGNKVVIFNKEQIPQLKIHLRKKRSPQIVVIDSITALTGFTRRTFADLMDEFPDKLFIFIAHEENHKPYPAIAQHVRKLSEVKCHVEGFRAYITTRFQTRDGHGGEPFTIWQQGADEYDARII